MRVARARWLADIEPRPPNLPPSAGSVNGVGHPRSATPPGFWGPGREWSAPTGAAGDDAAWTDTTTGATRSSSAHRLEGTLRYAIIDSPLGPVTVVASEAGVREVSFGALEPDGGWILDPDLPAATQLREYFAGERRVFDLPRDAPGTPFQREVWDALCDVPYGQTTSYGELAARLGRPGASRAVGAANGRNPIAIIVPCHRVVGADGTLTGYAGGLDVKRALLGLERGGELFG